VKIIGATSHYVTEELDEGPIIEQDITRVSHINSVDDFIMKGKDLERTVLARAIKLHAERKVMVYSNKTVVFFIRVLTPPLQRVAKETVRTRRL
jgi:formyltetrahydrofolate deformylase